MAAPCCGPWPRTGRQRPLKGSPVDVVEPAIRELLRQHPTMPATVIAERIGCDRWTSRRATGRRDGLRSFMVSGSSRMITARMPPSRTTADLIDGHWRLLTGWQAVPKMLVWDNEPGVG